MSDSITLKKHKLELNRETIMPLTKDELANVNGADNAVGEGAKSAAASAASSLAISAFIGESLTACPAASAVGSAIGSVVSYFFC